jgi:beta-1,4-galactosyltransferase 1
VAIIIPYRNRKDHLKHWLYYLHPILKRQQVDYGVYVINQHGEGTFNRAKLLNVGYVESLKEYAYDCFVFSDVDLVPMDDRNLYRCHGEPRHMASAMDKFGFQMPYTNYFGGVVALSREQYMRINGFPNNYWDKFIKRKVSQTFVFFIIHASPSSSPSSSRYNKSPFYLKQPCDA